MADTPDRTTKRRVKNPETFRERAIKAAEAGDKPTRKHRVRSAGRRVTSPVVRPVGHGLGWLFQHQPFKFIGKIIRFIGRILVPRYFRNSWKELKLVTWPSFREARQLTVAVMIFAIVFGGVVAGVDYGLDKIFRSILLK